MYMFVVTNWDLEEKCEKIFYVLFLEATALLRNLSN